MNSYSYLAHQCFTSQNRHSVRISDQWYDNLSATLYWLALMPTHEKDGNYHLTMGNILTFQGKISSAMRHFDLAVADPKTRESAYNAITIWALFSQATPILEFNESTLTKANSAVFNTYQALQFWLKHRVEYSTIKYLNHSPQDALFVLGCKLKADGTPSKELLRRLDHSVQIYTACSVRIIVSGGMARNGMTEAKAMYQYLIRQGVDKHDIYLEDQSTNTLENIAFSLAIIENLKPRQVIVVSDQSHAYRAAVSLHAMANKHTDRKKDRTLNLPYFSIIPSYFNPTENAIDDVDPTGWRNLFIDWLRALGQPSFNIPPYQRW